MARKYYVVWKGRTPGVYTTWDEAKAQVDRFPGARYKSFPSLEEANARFAAGYEPPHATPRTRERRARNFLDRPPISLDDLPAKVRRGYAVDAAWNASTKVMEYRCVKIDSSREVFRRGPFEDATINVGEFLAIGHAISYLKKRGITAAIYSDSLNAILWIAQGKCKTRLKRTEKNEQLFELIARAERWLSASDYCNAVLKWRTEEWGENPADFGRK